MRCALACPLTFTSPLPTRAYPQVSFYLIYVHQAAFDAGTPLPFAYVVLILFVLVMDVALVFVRLFADRSGISCRRQPKVALPLRPLESRCVAVFFQRVFLMGFHHPRPPA